MSTFHDETTNSSSGLNSTQPTDVTEPSISNHNSEPSQSESLHRQREDSQDTLGRDAPLAEVAERYKEEQENAEVDRDVEKRQSLDEEGNRKEEKDPNIVTWDGPDDPENPMNFPAWYKWVITSTLSINTFASTFASSVFSTAVQPTAKLYHVSPVVTVLGLSLFVLGFAFGPIVFGPLSEIYGRKNPLFFGMFVFTIFNIPVAVARNLQTIFVCRFFGGFFGSAPLAIIGGALADIFEPIDRSIAISLFSACTFVGPSVGPIIGGFITKSYLGWRWTQWITLIMSAFFTSVAYLIVPETCAPILLSRRAKTLRYKTKNWALHAEHDETRITLIDIGRRYCLRPILMLFLEPILALVTLYMGFVYAFLYLCFEAYPIAFQEERHWNQGVGELPFIALIVGVVLAVIGLSAYTHTRFKRKMLEAGHVVPEERLPPMAVGGFLLPAGMFWFGWTSNPHISWIPQAISGSFLGAGVMLIFINGLNYIIDVYGPYSNSAIAANTFVRSFLAAGFPIFATGMFHNLGLDWGMSLLGFLTVLLFPVPILFYIYGEKIRKLSRYTPEPHR